MIRKTSLLHKTDPTALRSSFADMSIAGASIPSRLASREILLLEMPGVAHRSWLHSHMQCSDRSPLHDVRQPARPRKIEGARIEFLTNELLVTGGILQPAIPLKQARIKHTRFKQTSGGARRDRTDDLLLAKQALSQLSYGPSRCQASAASNQKSEAAGAPHLITDTWLLIPGVGGPGKIWTSDLTLIKRAL
jgi:hypothetical protein